VELINTIVANNRGRGNPSNTDCSIPIESKGHNLDSDGSCGLKTELNDKPRGNASLGPTETHALQSNSDAIDAGNNDICAAPPVNGVDQRGFRRVAPCNIGAFEFGATTAITLLSFTAEAGADYVTLAWETGTEVDNTGFNLWRSEAADGLYIKLNDALIPAEGDPVSGASYAYTDTTVVKGVTYYYKLKDVDIYGVSTFHGPVSATPGQIHRIYLPLIFK